MKNQETNSALADNYLAFKMFCLRKKIEDINGSKDSFSDQYIEKISSQRKDLLNQFYQKQYGDNVCCFG